MKTFRFRSTLLLFLFIGYFFINFNACSKKGDPTPASTLKSSIVASWNVSSLTQAGIEVMGILYNSQVLKFDAYSTDHGTAVFTTKVFDGSTQVENYTYVVNEATNEVTIKDTYGLAIIAKVTLSDGDNKMEWTDTEITGQELKRLATKQ